MGGQVLFQDALKERLDIIQPSHQDIEGCLKLHPLRITPGECLYLLMTLLCLAFQLLY